MKDFTSFDSWDIAETIQSQYATSKRVMQVINAFWQALNPKADIKLLYNKLINPETAEGYGLDVWGRIVAIGRSLRATNDTLPYFAFKAPGQVVNELGENFDNAPFYKLVNGKVQLSDPAYRTYIFLKAMVKMLFPDADIQILHTGTMALRVLILSPLSVADIATLNNLPWLPAGVGLEMYQVVTPTFGFAGTGLKNFNQGTFATYGIEKLS